jgi:murein DD-endopeptidase MepM/ murein hydrolase activator NlpD
MKHLKFYYNPETCRYEAYRISIWSIMGYAFCFFATTSLLFVGIQFLHNRFFETENVRALRLENKALKTHYADVHGHLTEIETTLTSLKAKEATLHQTIFDSPLPHTEEAKTISEESILLADASGFNDVLNSLREKLKTVALNAALTEALFSKMDITKNDIPFYASIPSTQPIHTSENSTLASGFGKRINPYHKGNHFHSGVDFSAPRGTPVSATGNGTVIRVVKNSTLQAGYGNYVEINNGKGFITRFAHLEEVFVKQGQKISKGTPLGTVGATGGAIAPHVHYEVIRNNKPVNPVHYMMDGITSNQYSELLKLGSTKNQSLD